MNLKCFVVGALTGVVIAFLLEYSGVISINAASDPCNDTRRFSGSEKIAENEGLTYPEACERVRRYVENNGGRYGAFLSKAMINQMFTDNDKNGIWIFLGKTPSRLDERNLETDFIVKASKEDFVSRITTAPNIEYFKIDAMCPAVCDGMDVEKCGE